MPAPIVQLTLVVMLSLIPGLTSISQGQQEISGLFQIGVTSKKPKILPDQRTIFAIEQTKDKLYVVDLQNPKKLIVGYLRDSTVEIPLDLYMHDGKPFRVTFKGVMQQKRFEGKFEEKIGDTTVEASWKGNVTLSAWYCGNHTPRHVAFTPEDLAECTRKHKCTGWTQVTSSEVPKLIREMRKKEESKDGDDGRAVVTIAIQAAGGEAKLAKFQASTWKEKGTYYGTGDGLPYTGVYAINRPNQFRMEIEGAFLIVLNGDAGWIRAGGETKAMSKAQLASEQQNHKAGWITTLLPLTDEAFKVIAEPAAKGDDPKTIVVRVSRKDYPTVKLYFDKKTYLLVKSVYSTKAADLDFKEVVMENSFSDFREVDGAKLPHKMSLKRDGKRHLEAEFTELKAGKVDPGTFNRPGQ